MDAISGAQSPDQMRAVGRVGPKVALGLELLRRPPWPGKPPSRRRPCTRPAALPPPESAWARSRGRRNRSAPGAAPSHRLNVDTGADHWEAVADERPFRVCAAGIGGRSGQLSETSSSSSSTGGLEGAPMNSWARRPRPAAARDQVHGGVEGEHDRRHAGGDVVPADAAADRAAIADLAIPDVEGSIDQRRVGRGQAVSAASST